MTYGANVSIGELMGREYVEFCRAAATAHAEDLGLARGAPVTSQLKYYVHGSRYRY